MTRHLTRLSPNGRQLTRRLLGRELANAGGGYPAPGLGLPPAVIRILRVQTATLPEVEALPHRPLVRRLSPPEGVEMRVRFGNAWSLLRPQLAHPDRLRSSHLLHCRADLFEAAPHAAWRDVVAAVVGDDVPESLAAPLDVELAERLGLLDYVGRGRTVLRLTVLEDPTESPPGSEAGPVRPAAAAAVPAASAPPIAERFCRPWEFTATRQQAIAAGQAARRARRGVLGRLRRWWAAKRVAEERRAWQDRLAGRPLEEQLWGIRPTADLLLDKPTRVWIGRALALAGHDDARMVREWEVFWRRKGV